MKSHRWLDKWANNSQVTKNTIVLTSALGVRAILVSLLFFLITQHLEVAQYGKLTAVVAFVSFFCPFVGLGSTITLVKNAFCTTDEPCWLWGRALKSIAYTSIPLTIVVILGTYFIVPDVTFLLVATIATAELILTPIIHTGSALYQSGSKPLIASSFSIGIIAFRLIAFVLFFTFSHQINLEVWGIWYLASSLIFTILVVAYINADIGLPKFSQPNQKIITSSGESYSLIQFSGKLTTNVDKVMLSRMDTFDNTGLYSAGYRIMELLYLPIEALAWSSLGKFFKLGEKSAATTARYGINLLTLPIIYLISVIILVYSYSHYIPRLLGAGYEEIDSVVFSLSLLMIVLLIKQLLKQTVIAIHASTFSASIEIIGIVINLALNFILIPIYSWKGAIIATFISEIITTAIYSSYIILILRKDK